MIIVAPTALYVCSDAVSQKVNHMWVPQKGTCLLFWLWQIQLSRSEFSQSMQVSYPMQHKDSD